MAGGPERMTRGEAFAAFRAWAWTEKTSAELLRDFPNDEYRRPLAALFGTAIDVMELYVTDPQFAGFVDGMVLERKREQDRRQAVAHTAALAVLNRRSATAQNGSEL